MSDAHEPAEIVATRRWLERAVIGLNLCPFAKAVHAKRQIRFALSDADLEDDLLEELAEELLRLRDTPADEIDTTLLVHPRVLTDFLDYNDFLDRVDALIEALDLDGTLQVASFHPQYLFADTDADDPGNCTNRAPYPTLHLLREASLDKSIAAYPDADVIVQRNLETMTKLGLDGFHQLLAEDTA
jgi:uncharacterized protein